MPMAFVSPKRKPLLSGVKQAAGQCRAIAAPGRHRAASGIDGSSRKLVVYDDTKQGYAPEAA